MVTVGAIRSRDDDAIWWSHHDETWINYGGHATARHRGRGIGATGRADGRASRSEGGLGHDHGMAQGCAGRG